MKTLFLIVSNSDFMPRALLCKTSFEEIYTGGNYKTEIVQYEGRKMGSYLEGFAAARIRAVKDKLRDFECVVMLGADCVLYHNMDFFLSLPGKIVLAPHVITPPRNAAKFYQTGNANGDVVCFRQDAVSIIDWMLTQPMNHLAMRGMFFEQTLLSALPFISDDIAICRDPALNYAYYNFYERHLELVNEQFFVNQRPLALCQFSGYIDGQPEKISKYYRGPVPPDDVLSLFRQYQQRLDKFKLQIPGVPSLTGA